MGTVCAKAENPGNCRPSTSPVFCHHGSFEAAMSTASKSSNASAKGLVTVVQIVPVDVDGKDIPFAKLVSNMSRKRSSHELAAQLSKILKRVRKVRVVLGSSDYSVKGTPVYLEDCALRQPHLKPPHS
eukprot:scaffold3948_cov309-Prasinococcus_capsulatus_cf.AAC.1